MSRTDRDFKRYLKRAALLDGSETTISMLVIDTFTELKPILWIAVLAYMSLC